MDDITRACLAQHVATYPDPADLAEWQTPPGPLECADCGWEWPCREALLLQVDALEAERDQAIPVLAAALAWRATKSYDAAVHLDQVVATWRAGWKG